MRLLVEAADGALGIAGGRIVAPSGDFDVILRVPDGLLRPGLVNAHDHLHRNHYGRLGAPPYANAYDWGRDIHARHADAIARGRALPRREALLRGAWKNLRAGVTTVVHHDPWEPAFEADFPLRVARVASAHSLGFGGELPAPVPGAPFAIHLAEGVDAASAAEVGALAARGLVTRDLLAVHAVGVDDAGIALLRERGAAIVWCPSSNRFLFGRTAPAALLAPGIDVLLGSDSLLTADGSLLRELRVARETALVDDDRLLDAVGAVAARRIGVEAPALTAGARADVVVLRRPLLGASEADVALVVANGVLRVADPALVPALGALADAGRLETQDGVVRWIGDQRVSSPERGLATSIDSSRAAR
ncbi:MAG: amidohydrolase family protein [Gemmatimonadetes bacterium]|nr:amidohydrolase family protein [Gemmatimonadota bacterium]